MLHPDLLEVLVHDRQRKLRAAADHRRLATVVKPKRRAPLSSLAVAWLGQAARAWRPRRAPGDRPLPAPTNRLVASGDCATG